MPTYLQTNGQTNIFAKFVNIGKRRTSGCDHVSFAKGKYAAS